MKESGWALLGLGVLLIVIALFVDVTREVPPVPGASLYAPELPREVVNLQAMHVQTLLVHGGLAAIIAGTIAIGFGTLAEALGGGAPEPDAEAPVADAATPPPAPARLQEAAADERVDEQADSSLGWAIGFIVTTIIVILLVAAFATSGSGRRDDVNATDMAIDVDINADADALNALDAAANAVNAASETLPE